MSRQDPNDIIRNNADKSYRELARMTGLSIEAVRGRYKRMGLASKQANAKADIPPPEQVKNDVLVHNLKESRKETDKKYKFLLKENEFLRKQLDDALQIGKRVTPVRIKPEKRGEGGEATAFLVASDWHVEELVTSSATNGLNEFNLDIARERAENFFRRGHRLVEINQSALHIETLVVPLLGDFISGHLHPELVETTLLPPTEATLFAKELLISGFDFLLRDKSIKHIIVPCHSGNHGRTTKDYRFQTEHGHSWEYMMYRFLENHYSDEPRIQFLIPHSQFTLLDVYGFTIRLHHGHNIKYGGGVGGITIPVNKAIAQWSKPPQWEEYDFKPVSLDVFGHFHQKFDGGWFIANGSLIGYNAYAMSIKAVYQRPEQTFFLIDRDRGKTGVNPILLD